MGMMVYVVHVVHVVHVAHVVTSTFLPLPVPILYVVNCIILHVSMNG